MKLPLTETGETVSDYVMRRLSERMPDAPPEAVALFGEALDEVLCDAMRIEREACAALISSGKFCRHVDHVQGFCDCAEMAAAIRARNSNAS